jgi:hypothetical protein
MPRPILTKHIKAGSQRAYDFSLHQSAGGPYLLIDEMRHTLRVESMTGKEYTRRRIAVFADHLPQVIATLQDIHRTIKTKRPRP